MNNFESGKIFSWNDSHPSFSTILSITPSVVIIFWAKHLWWANPAEWWKFKNAAIVAIFAGMILVPLMNSRLKRNYALFRAIVIWVAIALIAYTLLSAVWGGNFRAGWEDVEFSNFRDRLSSVFTAIGGIGAVGYLVIKYRQQAGSERELSRLIVREADDKLMQAVQQLSSHSAQARLAGVYALSEIADVYGSEEYVTDYNKRVVDVLEKLTDADVYEIEIEKPYTKLTAYTIGLGHCKTGYEPPIKNEIDLSAYNKIFIGGPAWWFTYAPPINSFIKKYDLTDKIVYPFGTATSNFGSYFEKFNKECKAKEIKKPLKILRSTLNKGLEEAVKLWIDEEYNK